MKLQIEVSEQSARHILEYLEMNSDEGNAYGSLPQSENWLEFQFALEKSINNQPANNL